MRPDQHRHSPDWGIRIQAKLREACGQLWGQTQTTTQYEAAALSAIRNHALTHLL